MKTPDKISSITVVHNLFKLKKPMHPLICVFDLTEMTVIPETLLNAIYTDFYVIALKKDCAGKCKYGQQYYDFEEGIMYFIASNQVFQFEDIVPSKVKGSVLIIYPDFLQGYPLAPPSRSMATSPMQATRRCTFRNARRRWFWRCWRISGTKWK